MMQNLLPLLKKIIWVTIMLPEQDKLIIQLYKNNFWKLKRYAQLFMNAAQSEEIVQDVFHEAVEKVDQLLSHPNPDAWLMQVLKNKIRNYQRTAQRDLLRLISIDTETTLRIPAKEEADTALQERESAASTIQKITASLSEQELHQLKRIIYEKASHKEFAEEVGISVWTSQKRLERARDKLAKLFPGYRKEK